MWLSFAESESSLVQVDKEEEETLQVVSGEGSKKNDNDQEIGDLAINADLTDIPVLEYANTETNDGMLQLQVCP